MQIVLSARAYCLASGSIGRGNMHTAWDLVKRNDERPSATLLRIAWDSVAPFLLLRRYRIKNSSFGLDRRSVSDRLW